MIKRKETRQIKIGNVKIGGGAPISIQSMCSVPTRDISKTLNQIERLAVAGCEIVRLGIPDKESAEAVAEIKKKSPLPLVADIHFDYRLALITIDGGVDALRINPGNLKNRENVEKVVSACQKYHIPIRVGVNAGSIDRAKYAHPTPEALVDSAMGHIKILEEMDFSDIKVSIKSSDVVTMIEANRLFSGNSQYPIHLGVTEAGGLEQAMIKSAIGIGNLLMDGIGDTLRVSITGDVEKEVETARIILRSLGLRKEGIEIISCPTCARKEYDVEKTVEEFSERTRNIRKYLKVAIMGCVVNGPGEAKEADLGIAMGKKDGVLFKEGKIIRKIHKENIIEELMKEVEKI